MISSRNKTFKSSLWCCKGGSIISADDLTIRWEFQWIVKPKTFALQSRFINTVRNGLGNK